MKTYTEKDVHQLGTVFKKGNTHYHVEDIWRTYNTARKMVFLRYIISTKNQKDKVVGITQKELNKNYTLKN